MRKYKTGYTQGVFDMFHVGHLNLLNNAKKYCEKLIVGVNSDELVELYKHKRPVIDQNDRRLIVENIKAVEESIIVTTLDKTDLWKQLHFDVVFIGDDWKGNPRWEQTQKDLAKLGVDVIFLPHTNGICSTGLRYEKDQMVED